MTERRTPPPPAHLSEEARALWKGLSRDALEVAGGAEVDFLLLENLLLIWDRLAAATAAIAEEGLTVTGSKGQMRPHPLLSFEAGLRREFASGLDQLGLSPKSRATSYLNRITREGRIKRSD